MKGKVKIWRVFCGFLVFMAACSLVSRGIYAWKLPQVTVKSGEPGSITHTLELDGTFEAVKEQAVMVPAGIRVDEVCVEAGEPVKKGRVLLRLNKEELEEEIKKRRDSIRVQKQSLLQGREALRKQKKLEKQLKQRTIKRQKEDLDALRQKYGERIHKAQAEYRKARKEWEGYPSLEQYISDEINCSIEYQSQKKAAEKKDATQEERDLFQLFDSTFREEAKNKWEEGRKEALQAVKQAKQGIEEIREEKHDAIADQKLQNRRNNEDTESAEEGQGNDDSFSALEQSIEAEEKSLAQYEALMQADGEVVCERGGVVKEIYVSVGGRTGDGASVLLSDAAGGFTFCAPVTDKERSYLNPDEPVKLILGEDKAELGDVMVSGILGGDDGEYRVLAKVKSSQVSEGQTGVLKQENDTGQQECRIPLSGLYAAGTVQFVYVLRERETFLGKEYRAERRVVTVTDRNDEYAALKGNPLGSEERIIVFSDKEIADGDSVRLAEEA